MAEPSAWARAQAESICRFSPCNPVPDIAEALDNARTQGRREGLEEAAKVCDWEYEGGINDGDPAYAEGAGYCATAIRNLTPPTEPTK